VVRALAAPSDREEPVRVTIMQACVKPLRATST
jgi:hypothetical protein